MLILIGARGCRILLHCRALADGLLDETRRPLGQGAETALTNSIALRVLFEAAASGQQMAELPRKEPISNVVFIEAGWQRMPTTTSPPTPPSQ